MDLLLPLNGAVLRVEPVDQNPDGLLRVLRSSDAPIEAWRIAAEHLLVYGGPQGPHHFEAVLTEATEREEGRRKGPNESFGHIQALCCLAELKLQQAAAERGLQQRTLLLSACTNFCNKARHLDIQEQLPELVLGAAALVRGDSDTGKQHFMKAMGMKCNGRSSVAPQLALASIHFEQQRYNEALRLYKAALRVCPSCPPEVRLGIAACCLKLGHTAKAEAAYRRTLELAPGCTPALLGLAVLKLHVSDDDQGVREGSHLLAQAFEQDPESPLVLLLLAHFCLRQGFADKARLLAQSVLQHAGTAALRAEATTILARAAHALGQMQEAFQCYQQASHLDPKLLLPRLGLAQANVLMGEHTNAASLLESALVEAPHWGDALEVLARVYSKTAARRPDVLAQFKEAAVKRPSDADFWEALGDLLASLEPAGALKAYNKAIEIRRDAAAKANGGATTAPLSARLLNNAAVLHLRAGESEEALRLMGQAVAAAASGGLGDLSAVAQVTLSYNLARVKEASGALQAAEAEYCELLRQFPRYGDCCLRLACVAKARGDTKMALHWAGQAVDNPGYAADALALQAGLYLEKRDYHNAKQVLDTLLARADGRHESFARLAMANLHAYSAPTDRGSDGKVQRAEVHCSHALELYRRVLERDEGCIFAANGVGCILAEVGDLTAAKEVFLQVQEASAASAGFWRMPDAWVNLGNVYLAQQQYTAAIQMYRGALRRFYDNRNAVVMLYLARAHYDADQLPEAKRTLTKALHLAPTDHKLRFNVAVTMQEWAVRTLQRKRLPGDPSRLADLRSAVKQLMAAHRFFRQLLGLGPGVGLDARKLEKHINFIAQTHNGALDHLKTAEEDSRKAEQRQAAAMAEADAQEKLRRLAEGQRRAEEEARRRRLEEQARSNAERLRQLQDQWRASATMQKAVAAGDSSAVAKGGVQQGADVDARVDALFESSEDDEDYNPDQDDEGRAAAAADARGGRGGAGPASDQHPAAEAGREGGGGEAELEDEIDFGLTDEDEEEGGLQEDVEPQQPRKRAKHRHGAAVLDEEEEDE